MGLQFCVDLRKQLGPSVVVRTGPNGPLVISVPASRLTCRVSASASTGKSGDAEDQSTARCQYSVHLAQYGWSIRKKLQTLLAKCYVE